MERIYYTALLARFFAAQIANKMFRKAGINKKIKPAYGRKLISDAEGNATIKRLIADGKPFVAGRFGSNELNAVTSVMGERYGILKVSEDLMNRITNGAGVFPKDKKTVEDLADLMISQFDKIDYLGYWNDRMEDYIVRRYMPQALLSPLKSIEPYYYDEPWSAALEGKKVLVIHPFAESIRKQYERREHLFEKNVLPEFELITMKAVQTIAGSVDPRFSSWFQALDFMYEEALKTDFDIALVGCGAYGLPLSVKLKEAGKQVIHMGGSLQILFGIKGKRWDDHPTISKLYNEYWIRPSELETPKASNTVEQGCYW